MRKREQAVTWTVSVSPRESPLLRSSFQRMPLASRDDQRWDTVNGPAKLPLFDPFFALFEHDRPDHGLKARTADRAVL